MKCDICKKNEATIHIQEIMNGKKKNLNLCNDCASKKKLQESDLDGFNLSEILYNLSTHIMDSMKNGEIELPSLPFDNSNINSGKNSEIPTIICPKCNWNNSNFRKTGRLGCAECYPTFASILKHALSNMHKGTIHLGKQPSKVESSATDIDMKILYYQQKLDESVKKEDYEEAAIIRDKIYALKKNNILKSTNKGD